MKMRIQLFLFLTAFVLSVGVSAKSTIAVLPFKVGNFANLQIGNVNITRSLVETEFSNQLMAFLVKSGKFKVLDRESIKKVMDEYNLTESEWSKPGQIQKIGKLLIADYLVVGTIDRVEFQVKRVDIKITGQRSKQIIATFKVSFHITDIATGRIVYADTLVEKLKSRDVKREISPETWRDWDLQDYKDLLFKRTVTKAGNAILLGIYPVKIASVDGKQVVLNRGKGAGISIGQRYNVFNQGEVIKDPDSGDILGQNETKVGVLEITSVEPKFSKAKIVEQEGIIEVKAICRLIGSKIEDPEPDYPEAGAPKW